MNEIYVTVIGNLASAVTRRRTFDGAELASFRMASNVRRYDRESGDWQTAGTSFFTVTAWRQLGCNVAASFVKGDPVVVHGRVSTREYVTKEGVQRTDVEIDASAIGPDLSRCTAALTRPNRPAGAGGTTSAIAAGDASATADGDDDLEALLIEGEPDAEGSVLAAAG